MGVNLSVIISVASVEFKQEKGRRRHQGYGQSNMIVQHMLRKRVSKVSADVFHPKTGCNSTFSDIHVPFFSFPTKEN